MPHRATKECRSVGPLWLGLLSAYLAKLWANLMGVRIASLGGEGLRADKSQRYLYVWHPHGFVSYVPANLMGGMALTGEPHDRPWFGTCIPLPELFI